MLTVTATNLPLLMTCNGSRLMEGFVSSIHTDDTDKQEGIAAHWLIEQTHSGQITAEELVERKAANGVFITNEMVEFTEEFRTAHNGLGHVEVDTSFAGKNWQINGRADRIALYMNQTSSAHSPWENTLYVDDFKYGWGHVEPEWNWTLISHAIGHCFRHNIQPDAIVFTIYQPRPHHPDGRKREWRITYLKLMELYHQIDATLSQPSDLLVTSPHCAICSAFVNCPAARKAIYNSIDASEMAFNDKLDDATLSITLDVIKRAAKVLKDAEKAYDELALHRVKHGAIITNYGIDNDLTNLQWKDFANLDVVKAITGRDDIIKQQLLTPTQLKKLGIDEVTIDSLSERKNKGVKLVRVDENKRAEKLFKTTKGK